MFRSQINPPRSFQRFFASDLATSHSSLATALLTPFPATLSGKSQLIENPAALSRVVATLTHHVHHNPIVCHSYKKHPGSHLSSQRSLRSGFSRPNLLPTRHSQLATISSIIRTYIKSAHKLFRMNTSKTQDLKPFRMNTSEKTPGGRTVGGTPYRVTSPAWRPYSFARDDKRAIQPSFRGGTETLDPVRNHWYIACHTEGLTSKEFATPRPYRRDHTEVPNSSVSPTHQITKASQP